MSRGRHVYKIAESPPAYSFTSARSDPFLEGRPTRFQGGEGSQEDLTAEAGLVSPDALSRQPGVVRCHSGGWGTPRRDSLRRWRAKMRRSSSMVSGAS